MQSLPERTGSCKCGATFPQVRIAGRWGPETCPLCRPTEPVPQARPAYSGDILDDLKDAGVNVWKYGEATLEAAEDRDDPKAIASHDPKALSAARQWIRMGWAFPRSRRYPPRDWMYLYGAGSDRTPRGVEIGKLGNGKTYLAVAIARHLIEAGMLDPTRFRFATAESILIESEATFRSNTDDSEKNLLRRYETPDLLIIDDFGVRDMSPHAVRLFDELTKRREAKATIWTSNLSVKVVATGPEYMKRIADRIIGECGDGAAYLVEFTGESRRLARGRKSA